MPPFATDTKIQDFCNNQIIPGLPSLREVLIKGNIHATELAVAKLMIDLQNVITEALLTEVAAVLVEQTLPEIGQSLGVTQTKRRTLRVRTMTGKEIQLPSLYAKKIPQGFSGSRHLLAQHWSLPGNATPGYMSKAGLCASMASSYHAANELLKETGTTQSTSTLHKECNQLADICAPHEVKLSRLPNETLKEKRVVISVDGGRTRTRKYTGEINQAGHETYKTPWREPKLFVIDVLDKNGRSCRQHLPLYGCRFGEQDCLDLLRAQLKDLQINQAQSVQIVADGAQWIWTQLPVMLQELGVDSSCITQTLDHYHALQYVHKIVQALPAHFGEAKKKKFLLSFKENLWQGKSSESIAKAKAHIKRPDEETQQALNYLEKHKDRTQYADFKARNLMVGSGIIESGIRRIINLRFKNTATFWYDHVVEKLYFLRAIALSGRWSYFIQNLANLKC